MVRKKLDKQSKSPEFETVKKTGGKPKVLSSAWWKAAKDKTVKDQGLKKALEKWEAIVADLKDQPSRDGYSKIASAALDIESSAKKTISKCSKKLHAGSISCCEEFIALAKKKAKELKVEQAQYVKKYMEWMKLRKDAIVELKKLRKSVDQVDAGKTELLEKIRDRTKQVVKPIREPARKSGLHKDDMLKGIPLTNALFKSNKEIIEELKKKGVS